MFSWGGGGGGGGEVGQLGWMKEGTHTQAEYTSHRQRVYVRGGGSLNLGAVVQHYYYYYTHILPNFSQAERERERGSFPPAHPLTHRLRTYTQELSHTKHPAVATIATPLSYGSIHTYTMPSSRTV